MVNSTENAQNEILKAEHSSEKASAKNIYQNVINYCEEAGIPVYAFEDECGLSNATVRKWKDGGSPSVETLIKISENTGIPISEWLKGSHHSDETGIKYRRSYSEFNRCITERAITSYRVATDTNISPMTLSDWKHGKSKPKFDKLIKIAEYLEVDVAVFMDDE
jgi:transcriptional regulator with XRE-family HTH domain